MEVRGVMLRGLRPGTAAVQNFPLRTVPAAEAARAARIRMLRRGACLPCPPPVECRSLTAAVFVCSGAERGRHADRIATQLGAL
jgi:hypothetical protein